MRALQKFFNLVAAILAVATGVGCAHAPPRMVIDEIIEVPATWRQIVIGNNESTENEVADIQRKGYTIFDRARAIMEKMNRARTIDLVVVTGRDVGLEGNYTVVQMYDAAVAKGLMFCPAAVGPALRVQYADQPMYTSLNIGMRPVRSADGGLEVFALGRDADAIVLTTVPWRGSAETISRGGWVFCSP